MIHECDSSKPGFDPSAIWTFVWRERDTEPDVPDVFESDIVGGSKGLGEELDVSVVEHETAECVMLEESLPFFPDGGKISDSFRFPVSVGE